MPALVAVWRHPWIAATAAGLLGWYWYARTNVSGPMDNAVFVEAGRAIWHGHPGDALSDPSIQSGPVTLTLLGALDGVAGLVGDATAVAAVALSLLTAWCLTGAVRFCSDAVDETLAGAGLLGALGLAVAWDTVDGSWGHPSHAVVPLLWLLAVRAAQRRRPVAAGALLGLAIGFDTWAVLGACVLLVAWPDRRACLRAGLAALSVGALAWLPFLGSVGSAGMRWPASAGSLPSLLGQDSIGSGYRLLQAVVVLSVGCAVTIRLRGDADLRWFLPVVLVCARVVTDGQFIGYYANPVTIGLLVGGAVMLGRNDSRLVWLAPAAVVAALHVASLGVLLCAMPMVVGTGLALVGLSRPRGQLDAMVARARSAKRYESTPKPAIVPVATPDTTEV